jgi:ABC-type nitrate/sulfonate/bicarbonate transport system substrate-binding protein
MKALKIIFTTFCLVLWAGSTHAALVRVAYSAISGSMTVLWATHEMGLFKQQGLDTQLLYIGGGTVATQSLIGGDVQFVRLGANSVIQASLRGGDLKMICNTLNTLVFSLISKPELTSPKDLKGKKVGLTRLGGSTDYALDLLLKKWGLRKGQDVAVIQTGGMPQLLGALAAGAVDAGVISPPTSIQAVKLGMRELVDFADLGINYAASPVATTQSILTKQRDMALRFVRAYSEGIHRVLTDREGTIKVLAKYTKEKDSRILSEIYGIYGIKRLDKIPYVKLEGVEEVLRSEVQGGENARASDFVDNRLVSDLEHEGLFRKLYP